MTIDFVIVWHRKKDRNSCGIAGEKENQKFACCSCSCYVCQTHTHVWPTFLWRFYAIQSGVTNR